MREFLYDKDERVPVDCLYAMFKVGEKHVVDIEVDGDVSNPTDVTDILGPLRSDVIDIRGWVNELPTEAEIASYSTVNITTTPFSKVVRTRTQIMNAPSGSLAPVIL